ncbi:MAG: glycosyltransferase [Leptolyngbyaceae cyanobacterium MO_188.B28]|nr:glycosyltransferase [Leptolyngbyaceae cyanobacterium MO_188.B28]
MAHITVLTIGSRGDVQPFCALALGLQQRGHQVTLASSVNFADFASQLGIPFAPISGNYQELMSSPTGLEFLEGDNSATLINDELRWRQLLEGWNACQGSDLIVLSLLGLWGYHLAEALKIPAILAAQIPIASTRAFPFLRFAERTDQYWPGLVNVFSYRLLEFLNWRKNHKLFNQFRQEVLHLPPLPWAGARYRRNPPPTLSPLPTINCYSAAVVPPPSDWGLAIQQGGYLFLDTANGFTPPPALQAFLEAEPQPFYIGFGSMISRNPEKLAQTVISALEANQQRAVICSGWGNIGKANLPPSIYMIDEVPHDWLFPRVAAAIHHGGAGTTAATLKAGIPSIVVPFFADQPSWGRRLEQLGVSPATHPQKGLTCDQLTSSIQAIVDNASFREQAQQLRTKLQAEDGVAQAISIIESYLK